MAGDDGPDPGLLRTVRAYGAAHEETFGDVRWAGGRLVVSFTADLEHHRRRLATLTGDPSATAVEATEHTGAELRRIADEVRERYGADPRRVLHGCGPGTARVRARFEDVAAELHARYGSALDITLGAKPYPPSRLGSMAAVPVPVSTGDLPGLDVVFDVGDGTVAAGDDLRGGVVLTNSGTGQLRFATGLLVTAGVRRPGAGHLAGWFVGAVAAVAALVDLAPGASARLDLVVGTASVLPDTTYRVPPGTYEVVATIPADGAVLVRVGPAIEVTPPVTPSGPPSA